jgi:rubrerythrin
LKGSLLRILRQESKEGENMKNFSIREVIEQAVQTEKLGYEFYTIMSKKFENNENLKKLCDTLAVKELRHEKIFSELRDVLGEEEPEGWEEASQYLRAIVESEFFLGKNKSLPYSSP